MQRTSSWVSFSIPSTSRKMNDPKAQQIMHKPNTRPMSHKYMVAPAKRASQRDRRRPNKTLRTHRQHWGCGRSSQPDRQILRRIWPNRRLRQFGRCSGHASQPKAGTTELLELLTESREREASGLHLPSSTYSHACVGCGVRLGNMRFGPASQEGSRW